MIPSPTLPVPSPGTAAASPTAAPVQVDAFQPGHPQSQGNAMGQAFNNAIDGFSTRAQQMQASMRDMATREAGGGLSLARPPAQQVSAVSATAPVQPGAAPASSPIGLMVDSFNFAIEASLVSRAATQFTGAVSTLMKGQ